MIKLVDIFKILSDETRLRMLILLYQEELCVCELAGILNAPQPRISKNLSKLRDLNIVVDERKDRFVFYSIKKENVEVIKILEMIFENIDKYPQILDDKSRLKIKEKLIEQRIASC